LWSRTFSVLFSFRGEGEIRRKKKGARVRRKIKCNDIVEKCIESWTLALGRRLRFDILDW
jgi:hypothetical protein